MWELNQTILSLRCSGNLERIAFAAFMESAMLSKKTINLGSVPSLVGGTSAIVGSRVGVGVVVVCDGSETGISVSETVGELGGLADWDQEVQVAKAIKRMFDTANHDVDVRTIIGALE